MIKYVILYLLLVNNVVFGAISSNQVNKIVNSIYIIEGGSKTKYPYGIKSINTHRNYEKARQICRNTVINNYLRWKKSDKSLSYLEFLQRRYCPIGANDDPKNLNSNWLKNLRNKLGCDFKVD